MSKPSSAEACDEDSRQRSASKDEHWSEFWDLAARLMARHWLATQRKEQAEEANKDAHEDSDVG